MGDPITWSLLGVSAATQIAGGISKASMLSKQASYNAKAYDISAKSALESAKIDARQQQKRIQRVLGTQRAIYGAYGVDTSAGGTPTVVAEHTISEGEAERQAILYRGLVQATAYQNKGTLEKWEAKAQIPGILIGAGIGGGTTLLTGFLLNKET